MWDNLLEFRDRGKLRSSHSLDWLAESRSETHNSVFTKQKQNDAKAWPVPRNRGTRRMRANLFQSSFCAFVEKD